MKKFFCAFLSLLFILSFSASALAATITGSSGSVSFDLTGSYIPATQSDTYSVDIVWGSMDFEYHEADKVWSPSSHSYVANGSPYWTCDEGSNIITITNHSSKPISAALSYTADANYSHISASFDKTTINLDAPAENSTQDSAPTETATVTISGTLASNTTNNVKLGSVTITLSPQSSSSSSGSTSGGTVDTTTPVGYLNLYSKLESNTTDIKYNIYAQSSSVYVAEFTASAEAVMDTSDGPDTIICINNTNYYIYETANEDKYFFFTPGSTVTISTEKYDDFEGRTYNKATSVEEGTSYRMTIDLSAMTATLEEIS
ncbi:MAG: hypothetical protein IJX55_01880 [Clostridia bacterium]|nr:hypothetical protein [Clostridia bacterium]